MYCYKNFLQNIKNSFFLHIFLYMEHYSANAKNRKLKKQILNFLSRIGFAGGKLPTSGKLILMFAIILAISLLLPWVQITSGTGEITTHSAFSRYMGFIWYGIIISLIVIFFFLLSHTKKEHIRAYVPFRLSDTQAVVFVSSMLLVCLVQLMILSPTYQILGSISLQKWFILALSSILMMILCGFYLSRTMKAENTESYYLNRDFSEELWEYKNIIHPDSHQKNERKKENMSLPI